MRKNVDLVSGNIFSTLFKLSIPILGTSFIQMAYNMIDMIWIGRMGSEAVAAVGTAGFFTWFGGSLVFISKVGAEIGVAQAIGKNDLNEKNKYIYNSFLVNIIVAIVYTVLVIAFKDPLIAFFNLGDANIIKMAIDYLIIVSVGMIFMFLNPLFTGIFNATGNSKSPFIINTVGLVFNIVFDPILIFGIGGFPALGVVGAAIATVLAQAIVTFIFIIAFLRNGYSLGLSNKKYIDKKYINKICKLGMPAALQNGLFAFFAMMIGRVVSSFGPVPIAVQKVGSQIEAISWMTAGGFATGLTAFIGQNYGANKWDRIIKGFKSTLIMSAIVGIFSTILLVFAGEQVFSLFIPEAEAIEQGKSYLKILGYSQLFMCLEITITGAFAGLGNTITPSWVGIVFTGMRVPLCIVLSKIAFLGVDGVWWSISATSMIKGILLLVLFVMMVIIPNREKFKGNMENLQGRV